MRLTTASPQDGLRELPRWNSDFDVFVFEGIAHPVILLHGQGILSRRNARLLQPFRVHVEPACTVLHNSTVPILPFSAQEPVDEDLGRARMGRIFNDANNAECIACRQTFFRDRRGFNWQPGFDKGFSLAAAQAESDRDFPLARASASWRKSRVKKRSCSTSFFKNSSPRCSHINDQMDCPELGTRGSLKPMRPFHFGFK